MRIKSSTIKTRSVFIKEYGMKKALDLSFEVIKQTVLAQNSAGCKTNGSSGCCTTYCTTRACQKVDPENEVEAWDEYLKLNTGVLQY
jgi:hypothetical protein